MILIDSHQLPLNRICQANRSDRFTPGFCNRICQAIQFLIDSHQLPLRSNLSTYRLLIDSHQRDFSDIESVNDTDLIDSHQLPLISSLSTIQYLIDSHQLLFDFHSNRICQAIQILIDSHQLPLRSSLSTIQILIDSHQRPLNRVCQANQI